MPYLLATALALVAVGILGAVLYLTGYEPQHAGGDAPAGHWQPPTPRPEPVPVRLRQPRSCPDVGYLPSYIREAYEDLERTTRRYLDEIAAWPVSLSE